MLSLFPALLLYTLLLPCLPPTDIDEKKTLEREEEDKVTNENNMTEGCNENSTTEGCDGNSVTEGCDEKSTTEGCNITKSEVEDLAHDSSTDA